jgi:thioredoxin reductase (NADPH)
MDAMETEIAIVGGGPAGLATADTLQRAGREVIILEKGAIANHVAQYPTYMTFFSTADLLELGGMPLTIARDKPTREEYLGYLRRFVRERRLDVRLGHDVTALNGEKGAFVLGGRNRYDEPFEVRARRVILATGAYATPQKLGIPGEDLPKVSHYFREAHPYFGAKVLVVGGRNSAVETALDLWRAGVEVSMCHRRPTFSNVKYWLEPDVENRIKDGAIRVYRPARALEIKPASVRIKPEGRPEEEIANDFVLAMTGYRPDPGLLRRFGVEADPETGRPVHNPETLESNRPGLYIAGVMLAGNVSSEIFIENSREHGERILAHLNNGAGRRR